MKKDKIVKKYNKYKEEEYGNKMVRVIIEEDLCRDINYTWLDYIRVLIINTYLVEKIEGSENTKLEKGIPTYDDLLKLDFGGIKEGSGHRVTGESFDDVRNLVKMEDRDIHYFLLIYIERTIEKLYKEFEKRTKHDRIDIKNSIKNKYVDVRIVLETKYGEEKEGIGDIYAEFSRKVIRDLYRKDGRRYNMFMEDCLEEVIES